MREVRASEDLKVAMGPSAAVRMGWPSTAARIMQYYNFAIIAKKMCCIAIM